MPALWTFHPFTKLPPELRDMIWKFHSDYRGVRHCIGASGNCRLYAAIDIDTNRFADTFIPRSLVKEYGTKGLPVGGTGGLPVGGTGGLPARGTVSCIRLVGNNSTPPPGDRAESLLTMHYHKVLLEMSSPCIRINFKEDVVYFGYGSPCLRPLFPFNRRVYESHYRDLKSGNHWFGKIRHLAVQLAANHPLLSDDDVIAIFPPYELVGPRGRPGLETLYLVIYRDPDCPHGPPRQWRDFSREALNKHNFLPLATFVELHPKTGRCKCDCNLQSQSRLQRNIHEFNQLLRTCGREKTTVHVVVDPY